MLMVFYGLTLGVGQKTREYMKSRGFRIINKIVYEDKGTPVQSYFVERKLSAKEEIDACDFKYRTNYGFTGFNKSDIFDAIYGNENAVLAMTSENIEFLQHIKAGYGDAVPVIGAYITREAQTELIDTLGLSDAERESRMSTGVMVSDIIVENRHLFDDILVYGGESTKFNFSSIEKQLDCFIERASVNQKRFLDATYVEAPYQGSENFVFLSYSHENKKVANELLAFLQFNGMRVWYDAGIPAGDNWMNVIADKIAKSSAVIILSSKNSTSSEHVQAEVLTALRYKNEKKLIRINLDDAKFDPGIEMYFYSLNQLSYNEISYENKTSILDSLSVLGVKKSLNLKAELQNI